MRQVRFAQNPQLMLNQLFVNNPQLRLALDYIKQNGGNAQQAFYNLAKECGIDPQLILNSLNS